jgi:hypothetical protein
MPLGSGLLDSRLVRRRSLEISRLPSPYAKSVRAKPNYHAPGGPINDALIAPLRQSFRASMQRDSTAGSGKRRLACRSPRRRRPMVSGEDPAPGDCARIPPRLLPRLHGETVLGHLLLASAPSPGRLRYIAPRARESSSAVGVLRQSELRRGKRLSKEGGRRPSNRAQP